MLSGLPFQRTTDVPTKLIPETVTVKLGLPALALAGATPARLMLGIGWPDEVADTVTEANRPPILPQPPLPDQ